MTREEMLLQARKAQNAQEILALAKDNGLELSEEGANAYFEQLRKIGELADEELDHVAGGGCYEIGGNRLVVTTINSCGYWRCEDCGGKNQSKGFPETPYHRCKEGGPITHPTLDCGGCRYCSYEKGIWYCNHDANRK